ncbi:MAG: hypothetical protein JXA73_11825 [Acidobacteria bacterium]|nr:hypothetical protein [Acidobacteriota bacterium]
MRVCTSILLLILATPLLKAQDYAIMNLTDENAVAAMPFSISRVIPFDRGLGLFLNTNNPNAVSDLLGAGKLQAQLSDNQSGTEKLVPLSLGKAVWCPDSDTPVYLSLNAPLPDRGGKNPARIEYFLEAAVSLGPELDLAIGNDPDFILLIEER